VLDGQPMAADSIKNAECRCGRVRLEFNAGPIMRNECRCASCQSAGRLLQSLPGAASILNRDGATDYVLYRKDRFRCARGAELLAEHRLKPNSPTRRVLATCCNTAMFLDFTKGHWASVYRQRVAPGADTEKSGRFVLRLLLAWARMGFRRPPIDFVEAKLPHIRD
jgi:hypothetical protein